MATPQQESAAMKYLVQEINTWLTRHTVTYATDPSLPEDKRVTFAQVYLSDMDEIIKDLPPSSSQVANKLRPTFAFVSSVRIEHDVNRIVIVIDQANPLFPV